MKIKIDKKQMKWGLTLFFTAIAVLLVYFFLSRAGTILGALKSMASSISAILYGIIIAYVFTPVLNFIERHILVPIYQFFGIDVSADRGTNHVHWTRMRKISVFLTICFIVGILSGFFRIVVPQIISSIQTILSNFPSYINNIQKFLNQHLEDNPDLASTINNLADTYEERIQEFIETTVNPAITDLIEQISKSIISIIRNAFNFTVGLIVSVYLFYSKDIMAAQFKKMIYALFNEKNANEIVAECRFIHRAFVGFIVGKILDSIIIGILCFICIKIIGTPFPVLISFIVGVTNIIPFFGPYIGGIIGSIIVFMIDPIQALYFLIFVIILQQFDGNILGPKILGDSTGLSSFWVIFAIMFFGGIFGVIGWVIGVPLFAVIFDMIRRRLQKKLEKKHLPTDLTPYKDLAYIEDGELLPHSETNTKYRAQKPGSTWARLLHIPAKQAQQPEEKPVQVTQPDDVAHNAATIQDTYESQD